MLHYVLILQRTGGASFCQSDNSSKKRCKNTNFEDKSLRGAEQKKTKRNIYANSVSINQNKDTWKTTCDL